MSGLCRQVRDKGIDIAKNFVLIRNVDEVVRIGYDDDLSLGLASLERRDLLCRERIHFRYERRRQSRTGLVIIGIGEDRKDRQVDWRREVPWVVINRNVNRRLFRKTGRWTGLAAAWERPRHMHSSMPHLGR